MENVLLWSGFVSLWKYGTKPIYYNTGAPLPLRIVAAGGEIPKYKNAQMYRYEV